MRGHERIKLKELWELEKYQALLTHKTSKTWRWTKEDKKESNQKCKWTIQSEDKNCLIGSKSKIQQSAVYTKHTSQPKINTN
jgi:hypothetical protein